MNLTIIISSVMVVLAIYAIMLGGIIGAVITVGVVIGIIIITELKNRKKTIQEKMR